MKIQESKASDVPLEGLAFPSLGNHPKFVVLELTRFIAAFYVVGIHVAQRVQSNAVPFRIWRHTGQLPVMLFFVLSGFVIALRHIERKESFATYMRARFIRIYPVFLSVLLLATLLMVAAVKIGGRPLIPLQPAYELLGNIFMLQGPEFLGAKVCVSPWAGISPFWSLSFEWWYYAAFWAAKTYLTPIQSRRMVYVGAIVGALGLITFNAFPLMLLMLFAIWWSGAELAREFTATAHLTIKRQLPSILVLGALTILNIGAYLAFRGRTPEDALRYRSIMQWTGYGFVFLIGFTLGHRFLTRSFGRLDRLFTRLGALSYALYAVHFLAVTLFVALKVENAWLLLAAVSALSLVVADVLERVVHPAMASLIRRVWPSPIPAKA